VVICAGVIGTVNITFAPFSMVNLQCTVGHESYLGRGYVVNPGANISGAVHIGEGVLIGTGAQILQYVEVGDWAVVAASSLVASNVEPGTTVIGVPARGTSSPKKST
jgi:acetyltransferase-like isoleucine patch superfamily enzyme